MIKTNIHELVASRICHDLISPIGACANGAELLGMGGGSEEVSLIAESAANASARAQFFRIAFGHCEDQQILQAAELSRILTALSSDRLTFEARLDGAIKRCEARAVCLAILCLERALPRGGAITLKQLNETWTISAAAETLLITDPLWSPLSMGSAPDEVIPATVSFALLPEALIGIGRKISIRMTETRILMQF